MQPFYGLLREVASACVRVDGAKVFAYVVFAVAEDSTVDVTLLSFRSDGVLRSF